MINIPSIKIEKWKTGYKFRFNLTFKMYEIISVKSRIVNHSTIDFFKKWFFFFLNKKQEITDNIPVEKREYIYILNSIKNLNYLNSHKY
jgi:hypothetical protein